MRRWTAMASSRLRRCHMTTGKSTRLSFATTGKARHGYCLYGDHCVFAHGEQELRPVTRHARYKTKLCYNVLASGSCRFGHQCHFRHALSDNI
ncbi:hypothetical protein M0R45_022498 [Rubus argutus]|uniref:C3H1-type domain-containing protein n=1 Tax=Rubus argutus TaxID=59490 RepID=A0AAW1XG91_RUBAR